MSTYKRFVRLKHTGPFTVDLPVSMFVDTVEQKWHLRWQCVIVPSRPPDVSMHAAGRGGIMGGMGGGEKNRCVGLFAQDKFNR